MKIIIVGCGKVGTALTQRLCEEGHDITVVDTDAARIQHIIEEFDVMGVVGNGSSYLALEEAGAGTADVLIAVTGSDELNLLCCMTAHGLNQNLHTIARIRTPEYAEQVLTMPQVYPLSLTVNPEKQAAVEIQRLLKYPGFLRRETFAKGRVEIVELRIDRASKLCDVSLHR